jgi:PAB-dependent poly(A)-specific ribonuclease subunit 2
LTSPYGSLIQSFNRWLLSTFSTESVVEGATFRVKASPAIGSTALETPSAIDQILGIMTTTTNKCLGCGHVSKRNATLQAVDLTYPKKVSEGILNQRLTGLQAVETSFGDLVRSAILRENSTKATCSNCKLFAPLESIRRLAGPAVETLPSVISVNAAVSTPEIFEIWRDKRKAGTSTHFLQKQVSILPTEEDAFSVGEGEGAVVYEVKVHLHGTVVDWTDHPQSIVVQVQESPDTPVHLLSFVKSESAVRRGS